MSENGNPCEGRSSNLRLSRRELMETFLGAGLGLGLAGSLEVRAEDPSDLCQGQEELEAGHRILGVRRAAG